MKSKDRTCDKCGGFVDKHNDAILQREMIYEAVALSERFPDLPDHEVCEHISFVFRNKPWELSETKILTLAVLTAYHTQNEMRGLDLLHRKG